MGSSTTSAKELCLQWKDFASILSRSFTEMREEADFFNEGCLEVVLVSDGILSILFGCTLLEISIV